MMRVIIVLCILCALFRQPVEAYGSFSETVEVMARVHQTLINVPRDISRLKANYQVELLEMKVYNTLAFTLMIRQALNPAARGIQELNDKNEHFKSCVHATSVDYIKAALTTDQKLAKCVEDKIDILKSVEENFAALLNDAKSCVLHLNMYAASMCSMARADKLAECIDIDSRMNSRTGFPLICEYDKYIIRQKELENNASSVIISGKKAVSQCMQQIKSTLQDTTNQILEDQLQCKRNIS